MSTPFDLIYQILQDIRYAEEEVGAPGSLISNIMATTRLLLRILQRCGELIAGMT